MEEDQQFCLRWNNHQSTLISVFDTLLENGTLVDCTLAAEGKFLKAHKVVLSACSPYFATLLSQQYDKHPIFILKDVKFQELRAMMDYMYRGEVNISQDQLGALLKAAESLQIKGLSDNRNSNSSTQKNDSKQPIPAPKSGLTIEQKRPSKHPALDIDSDIAGSREGSTSPTSRKRKKVRRRSIIEGPILTGNVTDNHDVHSNSSSQSLPHVVSASGSVNNLATSVVNVTKKTELQQQIDIKTPSHHVGVAGVGVGGGVVGDRGGLEHQQQQQQHQHHQQHQHVVDENDNGNTEMMMAAEDDDEEESQPEKPEPEIVMRPKKDTELLLEPKNEYDDGPDENVEDLTLEDEDDMMDEMEHAGPSHGGEGSSQGYATWQVDRGQDESFMGTQEQGTGQHRDAQAKRTQFSTATIKKRISSSLASSKFKTGLLDNDNIKFRIKDRDSNSIVICINEEGKISDAEEEEEEEEGGGSSDGEYTERSSITIKMESDNENDADDSDNGMDDVRTANALNSTIKNILKNSVKRSKQQQQQQQQQHHAPAPPPSFSSSSFNLSPGDLENLTTKDNNSLKTALSQFHPRIKYSKHKNPIIHHHTIVAKNVSSASSSPSTTGVPAAMAAAGAPIITHALARAIWPSVSSVTDSNHHQFHHHHHHHHKSVKNESRKAQICSDILLVPGVGDRPVNITNVVDIKPITSTPITTTAATITNSTQPVSENPRNELSTPTSTNIMMTDLEQYAEIDDIQLPDGSQIGFGDDELSSQHDDERKYSSASVDEDFAMMSHHGSKFEYLSDSAISANNDDGNRQYQCRHCGKRYRWKSTLRRHENVECGGKEPMHQCPHCQYKAKQRGNLGVHIRKHHTAMPPLESRRKSNKSM